MEKIQEKIRVYFNSKTKQILASSEQAIIDHSVLVGTHRESILFKFLEDILPKRYSIDSGMVYGLIGQSKQADIVIWDELNYPKLPMQGSSMFFSESVKTVIEVKSRYNSSEFTDVKGKVKAISQIFGNYKSGISDRIESIENDIWSLKSGTTWEGKIITPHKIGTVAIFYYGGENFDIDKINENEIEDEYPDIILFLEAGKVIIKDFDKEGYDELSGIGVLKQIQCYKDALLMFTSLLIDLLAKSSEHLVHPLIMTDYLFDFYTEFEEKVINFKTTKLISGNSKTFWNE